MKIHGFNKTTLLDYPGHVAATVFTGGCSFRCPFCHNGELVLKPETQPLMPEEESPDYVAMDIKAAPENYAKAAGCPGLDFSRIEESISILKNCTIPYEFRTTVVQGLHTVEEFIAIGRLLEGSRVCYLQAFRENENVIQAGFGAFPEDEMTKIREIMKNYLEEVQLRGIV